jgi:hypothetical protein
MARQDPIALAATLPCWGGRVSPVPLAGGLTNDNFLVEDGGERYVVRVHYADCNALVIGFVEGRTLKPREIAAVELHALDDIELGLRCLRLFDRNNTLVADFLHSVGDHLADGLVAIRSDRADLGDLFGGLHLLRSALDVLDDRPATAMSTPRFRSIGFIPALVSTPASQQAPPYTRARREGVRTGRLLELFGNHISL